MPLATAAHETVYTFFSHDPLALAGGMALDVRDATAVSTLFATVQPDVVIHTVGSNRSADMTTVIEQGTVNVAAAAQQVGARLVHLSTDSIFDGTQPPYDETAVPSPVNDYGRAKTNAETAVQTHPNHAIVRTSLIYGFNEMDHGTRWMAAALQQGQPVTLFDNQFRNPVWVKTLSLACLELATSAFHGVINVAGGKRLSRAEFSQRLLDWWQVEPRTTLSVGPSQSGKWPLDCTLDLGLAQAELNTPLLSFDQVLRLDRPHLLINC